jgi:hypothetical protein
MWISGKIVIPTPQPPTPAAEEVRPLIKKESVG